jgi:hypothetical protein
MAKRKALIKSIYIFLAISLLLIASWQLVKEFKVKAFIKSSLHTELNHYFQDSVHLQIDHIAFDFFKKRILLKEVYVDLINKEGDTLANLELSDIFFFLE